ncbi:hypothetical protein B0H11DRAFT_2358807 [Mycena galericulata]|nr:hypothetical protein B0H11DRAFT_2358807 [Mycena galericulata]
MQIGCSGHVPNLVAQDVTATLGLAPPVAEKDLYEDTRHTQICSCVFDPAEDPVAVVAEMELMEEDLKAGRLEAEIIAADGSELDLSDSDTGEDLWVDEAAVQADGAVQTDAESDADVSQEDEEPVASMRVKGTAKAQSSGKKGKKAKAKKVFTAVDKIHASVVHILRSEI